MNVVPHSVVTRVRLPDPHPGNAPGHLPGRRYAGCPEPPAPNRSPYRPWKEELHLASVSKESEGEVYASSATRTLKETRRINTRENNGLNLLIMLEGISSDSMTDQFLISSNLRITGRCYATFHIRPKRLACALPALQKDCSPLILSQSNWTCICTSHDKAKCARKTGGAIPVSAGAASVRTWYRDFQ